MLTSRDGSKIFARGIISQTLPKGSSRRHFFEKCAESDFLGCDENFPFIEAHAPTMLV